MNLKFIIWFAKSVKNSEIIIFCKSRSKMDEILEKITDLAGVNLVELYKKDNYQYLLIDNSWIRFLEYSYFDGINIPGLKANLLVFSDQEIWDSNKEFREQILMPIFIAPSYYRGERIASSAYFLDTDKYITYGE